MITRRDALKGLGGLVAAAAFPGLGLAALPGSERRLVLVFLRGGLDGLSAVPAYGDADFARRDANIRTLEARLAAPCLGIIPWMAAPDVGAAALALSGVAHL